MLELYLKRKLREAGGKTFVGKSLVVLDTDHIKRYVFGTNRLKEIRGASSALDSLNRGEMKASAIKLAEELHTQIDVVFANGGSGLFLVHAGEDVAEQFAKEVQAEYRERTGGGASLTYAVQEIPENETPDGKDNDIWNRCLRNELDLLQYRLQEAKGCPNNIIALPSHPFMRPCDACGIEYAVHWGIPGDPNREAAAEKEAYSQTQQGQTQEGTADVPPLEGDETPQEQAPEEAVQEPEEDAAEQEEFYCDSCCKKRMRDAVVKAEIRGALRGVRRQMRRQLRGRRFSYQRGAQNVIEPRDGYLWDSVINLLAKRGYDLFEDGKIPKRPDDFNEFSRFSGAKGYLGLIYADGNSMGKRVMQLDTLQKRKDFAKVVDDAVYEAMAEAIVQHLPIEQGLFPFDILLIGGDDVVVVVPAAKALDVALTLTKEFQKLTKQKQEALKSKDGAQVGEATPIEGYTLSVGVVLAPTKYPFGLLRRLAEDTLKFAKQSAPGGQSRINFMTVTGSTSQSFKKVYETLRSKGTTPADKNVEFYATLRPYDPVELKSLLDAIRTGNQLSLGRTKLHQVREAVLQKNLTTSVRDGIAVLRNWKKKQREHVAEYVYSIGGRYQEPRRNENDPASLFPRVTFPWFADKDANGNDVYRTALLDFVELYDFVGGEEDERGTKN